MKKLFKPVIAILLVLVCQQAFAQQNDWEKKEKKRYPFVKERNISKTYPAGNTLNIDNSFGDVIVTIGGNEIKVDIHIEASSTEEQMAQRAFDNLDVTDSKEGSQVKFKTTTNKNEKKNGDYKCNNCSVNMTINYAVQVPAGTPLNIDNSFGAINIPDYTGEVDLTSKFGSLTTGSLAKTKQVHVEFGKADIKSTADASYTFKFSTIAIGSLEGDVKMNVEFCNMSRITMGTGLSSLDLKESYSTIGLKPAVNLSVSYDITTSFGSFKNKTSTEIKRTDEPDRYGDFDKTYSGKSGSGSTRVKIRSSFGNVILGDASDEELKEKKKGKSDGKEI